MSIAVIPARAGSSAIHDKNAQPVNGIPMVVRAINACREANIGRIVVSTDSETIMSMALNAGALVAGRPKMLAGPKIGVDAAVRHTLSVYGCKDETSVLVIQPNLPLWQPNIIQLVQAKMETGNWTAVASAVPVTQRPEWMKTDMDGCAVPYMGDEAPIRRQDMRPLYYLDGQVIAVKVDVLMKAADQAPYAHHWMGNRIGMVVRPELYALEIHSLEDLGVADALAQRMDR